MAHDTTILVVDDDALLRETYRLFLEGDGYQVSEASSAKDARSLLSSEETRPDLVVLDVMLGEDDGLALLDELLDAYPGLPILMSTSSRKVEHAIFALKRGAYDYLVKPVAREELLLSVRNAAERSLMSRELAARRALDQHTQPDQKYGVFTSTSMKLVLSSLERAKDSQVPILVLGESGTGKEVVTRWLHGSSRRSDGPFVAVNCAALPTELAESELFGHMRGAFTGADDNRTGRFEEAHTGTLFLDEVGELDLSIQAKLLRALEQGEVVPVGGQPVKIDTRVVAATNRDLALEVEAGRFRSDLFYRLDVFTVRLPPLRERKEEIEPLARHFLQTFCQAEGIAGLELSAAAVTKLEQHGWPGNVRELQNAIKRAVLTARGDLIEPEVIEFSKQVEAPVTLGGTDRGVRQELAEDNRERMLRALAETRGNVTAAARLIGVGRSTFYRWAKTYSIPL